MRVHPTVVHSSGAKWHFPVAVALLLAVLVSNLFKGANNSASAVGGTQQKMVEVVVARTAIEAGKQIQAANLTIERRAPDLIPPDAFSKVEDVAGKYATAMILPSYPIAKPLVVDKSDKSDKKSDEKTLAIDLAAEKISKYAKEMIGVSLNFQGSAPTRGSRIAISIQNKTGPSVLVAEEGWVENVDKSNIALVRVRQPVALFLQDAKSMGAFSFFTIPDEGPSPFKVDEAMMDINKLRERIISEPQEQKSKQAQAMAELQAEKSRKEVYRPSDFSSYAWVTGEGMKYSVDKKGKMFVIDSSGMVTPLYDYSADYKNVDSSPGAKLTQGVVKAYEGNQTPSQPGQVHTGLEPLYPYAPNPSDKK